MSTMTGAAGGCTIVLNYARQHQKRGDRGSNGIENHYLYSSFREKLLEHLFVGEILKISWLNGKCDLEIATREVDNQGF